MGYKTRLVKVGRSQAIIIPKVILDLIGMDVDKPVKLEVIDTSEVSYTGLNVKILEVSQNA